MDTRESSDEARERVLSERGVYDIDSFGWKGLDEYDDELIGYGFLP